MSIEELRDLKQVFLSEYGYSSDRMARDVDKRDLFVVDDRKGRSSDFKADGQLNGWFCEVLAELESPYEITVVLRGGIPIGQKVKAWVAAEGVRIVKEQNGFRDMVAFPVAPSETIKLLGLAEAIEAVVAPGARYADPTWKTVCPRTAASLRRLYETLSRAWGR
jgi:hypothetical protein